MCDIEWAVNQTRTTPSTLACVASKVPSGECPAFLANSTTGQSENPEAGLRRNAARAAAATSRSWIITGAAPRLHLAWLIGGASSGIDMASRSIGAVLGVLFIVIGSAQMLSCVVDSVRALAAYQWATTRGTIQQSYVEVEHAPQIRGTAYVPVVIYTYEFNGKHFVGSRIHYANGATLPELARDIADDFPVGASAEVWVNPADPAEALLRPGLDLDFAIRFTLSFVAIGVGYILYRRSRAGAGQPDTRASLPS